MSINKYLRPAGGFVANMNNGDRGAVTLRSYQHAARIFTDADYRLSPKYGFLFYVEFDFNPLITSLSNTTAQELGMIVKNVTLPKYSVETKTHNAYNRVNIVQNKIKYDPISIIFHDDQADNVRNFWFDYYNFYYRDPDYADATYSSPHKYQNRPSFDWGYSPKATVGYNNANGSQPYQYIQAIRIYSLYQKNFSEYELINPTITKFDHGEHANGENTSLLQHSMSVQFETVKYYTGYTTANTVGGYIDLHYDNQPSPISPEDGTDLIDNNNGGFTHATDKITDLATANLFKTISAPLFNSTLTGITSLGSTNLLGGTSYSTFNSGVNVGGFSIPNLGNLPSGLPTGASISQQLSAGATNLAGSLAGQLSNKVVGSIAQGLGPNGSAIVGLVAQGLTNPKALLTTATNMAVGIGVSYASQKIQEFTTPYLNQLGTTISGAVSDFVSKPLELAWNNISTSVVSGFRDWQFSNSIGPFDPSSITWGDF